MNVGRTSRTMAFLGRKKTANLNFVISNSEPGIAGMSIPTDSLVEPSPLTANLIGARNAAVLEVQTGAKPQEVGKCSGSYNLVLSLCPGHSRDGTQGH